MLGILASGCVYLPLDPAYPPTRIRYMLDQAGAAAVVSATSNPDLHGLQRTWICPPSHLDLEFAASEMSEYLPGLRDLNPQDCAYIIFTSGSTGNPKGVRVTHENISQMNSWSAEALGITSSDASATTCSLSFDPSFHEILLPLSAGGTVHVIPHALALGELTRTVSFVATTPTVANELLRAGQLPPLKVLMLGGEALSPDVAARLLASGRVGVLLNCYGPTESTVCVTTFEVSEPLPEVIPIGRPVPGTDILILDAEGRQLPDGETGEICVFGKQVAVGYANDPTETAKRFRVGPIGAASPQRYYRTGDLGYRADGGVIYFAGRADRQVKINGYRIELEEIDIALRSHAEISDAATIARHDNRMISYVVPTAVGAEIDAADLRRYLSKILPPHMLPTAIIVVAELPTTVSGKLDIAALPESTPSRAAHEVLPSGEADQADALAARVIEIVTEVTGFAGQVRPSDDFVNDLGGTSLDIMRVLVEFEHQSGRRIRVNDALADTSIAGLISLLGTGPSPSSADFAFHTESSRPPVFMIHPYLGGMLGLRRVAELLPPEQPVYGLQIYPELVHPDEDITISTLAEGAIKRIRKIQPTGQITMIGPSAGGLIVFEAAQVIVQSGDPEPRVLLMDSARLNSVLGYYWGEWVLYPGNVVPGIAAKLRDIVKGLFRAGWRGARRSQADASPPDDLMTLNATHLISIASALKRYKGRPYAGSITIMRTRQGRMMAGGRASLGWANVVRGSLQIIDVPGTHLSMVEEPHVHTVIAEVTDWLNAR